MLLLPGQPHPAKRVRRVIRRHPDAIEFIYHITVRIPAAVSDPRATAGVHNRVNGRHKPTGRFYHRDLVAGIPVNDWFAVGDHDEPVSGHLVADQFMK